MTTFECDDELMVLIANSFWGNDPEFVKNFSVLNQFFTEEFKMMNKRFSDYLQELKNHISTPKESTTGSETAKTTTTAAITSQKQESSPTPIGAKNGGRRKKRSSTSLGSSADNEQIGCDDDICSSKTNKKFCKASIDSLNLWFFNHLEDPYPNEEEKEILSNQTGLSIRQVNNWFGNRRMRYKRRMTEKSTLPSSIMTTSSTIEEQQIQEEEDDENYGQQ